MKGHIRKRGATYELTVDQGRASARRCEACNRRVWVRDYQGDECPRCPGALGPVGLERRQHSETHPRKREAEAALARYVDQSNRGGDPFPRPRAFGQFLEAWLDERSQRLRPQTMQRYRQLSETHILPSLRDIALDRVRREDVQSLLDTMRASGLAPRTRAQARAVLRAAFNTAMRDELVLRNPVLGTEPPKAQSPNLTVLRPEDVRKIMAASVGTAFEIPILLAATTGCRRSEVLGLRWSDVDLDGRRLGIVRSLQVRPDDGQLEFLEPKTERSRRTITLPAVTVERLRAHSTAQKKRRLALGASWKDNDLVCDDGLGAPQHPNSFTKSFKRCAKTAGVPGARLHDLRHAVAVLLGLEGVQIESVSAMLGHATAGFTLTTYRHAIPELAQAAAEALDRRLR